MSDDLLAPFGDCGCVEMTGPRLGEHHVSCRFGDSTGGTWWIYIDGENVAARCIDAVAGDPGWVVLVDDPLRLCGDHIRQYVRRGEVRIRRIGKEAS